MQKYDYCFWVKNNGFLNLKKLNVWKTHMLQNKSEKSGFNEKLCLNLSLSNKVEKEAQVFMNDAKGCENCFFDLK